MSWQDHVSSLLASGYVQSAIIADLESQQIVAWDGPLAHSPGANIQQEIQDLIKALGQPSLAQGKGITLGGAKYFCIRAEEGLIYGKLGAGGLCAARTNKVVILGVYGEGIPPPKHNQTVEMFRDNFLQHGY